MKLWDLQLLCNFLQLTRRFTRELDALYHTRTSNEKKGLLKPYFKITKFHWISSFGLRPEKLNLAKIVHYHQIDNYSALAAHHDGHALLAQTLKTMGDPIVA